MLGFGSADASTRDKLDDRRNRTEGNRLNERGVMTEGRSRVVKRCRARPGTEKPFGYSEKYV